VTTHYLARRLIGRGCGWLILVVLGTALDARPAVTQEVRPLESAGVVRGRVHGGSSPIQGATVRVDTIVRVTDAEGRFSITVAPGGRLIHVTAIGYAPLDTSVDVTNAAAELFLVLRPVAVMLDSIRVTASADALKPARYKDTGKFDDFYLRKARALGGRFLSREDIERSGKYGAVDLLATVPGVRVDRLTSGNPFVRFARCSGSALPRATGAANQKDGYGKSATVQVFVDGKRVSEPFVTLGSLTADDVEAMEIYRGVSELPMEAAGDGCAAIFIWTRYTPGSVLGNKKSEGAPR
jgi:hypothetical protein